MLCYSTLRDGLVHIVSLGTGITLIECDQAEFERLYRLPIERDYIGITLQVM